MSKYEVRETMTIGQAICGVLVLVFLVGCFAVAGKIETHYERKHCVVVDVEDGIATIEDACGYVWEWETEGETLRKGETITLKMFNNHTDNVIKDDEIVKIVREG